MTHQRLISSLVLGLTAVGLAFGWLSARSATAEGTSNETAITTTFIPYEHDGAKLQGFLAQPAKGHHIRGAVMLVHAWRGQGEGVRDHATMLAKKGYIAFAADMYGKGVYAANNKEAAALAGRFKSDTPLMRGRVGAGLETMLKQKGVDPKRVAAVGFCFGGTAVLELARSGADIGGVVSFHGGLKTGKAATANAVKARILVAHGGDDPFVPVEELTAFWKEMRAAKADHQILILSDAVHSFTDRSAGDDPSRGAAYSKTAADRAWKATERFFGEFMGATTPSK